MIIFTECNLASIVFELLNGETVVFPTETSYGLGCDATNQFAVDKIYKIKGRDFNKPLLVVVPSIAEAKKYLVWSELLEMVSKKYWPGPLTIVGECLPNTKLASGVESKNNTVAVRVTAYPLLKSITEKLGKPLVATSANLARAGELYDSTEIIKIFENQIQQPDLVLSYGILPITLPTTIVSVVNNKLEILRQGSVAVKI